MVNMTPNAANSRVPRGTSRRSWSAARGFLRLVVGLFLLLIAPLQLAIAIYDQAHHGMGEAVDWPNWTGWVMALCGIGVLSRGAGLRRSGRQKMAEIAASMVNDGDHIFLDASTTAVFVAKALKEKERLTVVTNSMEILLELSDVSGWNIISTGGVMKEGYLAFLGARTEEVIRSYYVDKVIFSCKALNEDLGIMESKEAFGTTKKAMINSGKMRILVVDSTKFDQTAFSVAGQLRDIETVITDKKPSEKWLNHFSAHKIECIYPK